jgi:hypothetical protein
MKRLAWIGLSVVVAASLSCVALAEENHPRKADAAKGAAGDRKADAAERFKKMDTTGDGKLSLDEFKAGMAKLPAADAEAKFTAADADKDGFLTPEELKAAYRSREKNGEKRGEKGGAKPAPEAPAAPAP